MTEQEKKYDLAKVEDRKRIIDLLVAMGANQTLTFLLTEEPVQGDFGKVCLRAGLGRGTQSEAVLVDLRETGLGLALFATCALPETEEDDDGQD